MRYGLEPRNVPEPFEKRLLLAEKGEFTWQEKMLYQNCFGTAFFLLGILPYDVLLYGNKNEEITRNALSLMEKIETPTEDSLIISLEEGFIRHASYVHAADPLVVSFRAGWQGPFVKEAGFDEIIKYMKEFWEEPFTHEYYKINNKKILSSWAQDVVKNYTAFYDA